MMNPWQRFLDNPTEGTFEPVYEGAKADVWTICLRVLADEELAMEAFQGTWSRLLQAARTDFSSLGGSPTIVRSIAWREAERLRGQRRRRRRREASMSDETDRQAGAPDARQAAADRELRAQLEILVAMLPDKLRVPVQLHYFHGMSYGDIAATTGRPMGTISSQIARGLKQLQVLARRAGLRDVSAAMAVVAGGAAMLAPPAHAATTAAAAFAASLAGGGVAAGSTSPSNILLGVTIMKAKKIILAGALVLLVAYAASLVLLNQVTVPGSQTIGNDRAAQAVPSIGQESEAAGTLASPSESSGTSLAAETEQRTAEAAAASETNPTPAAAGDGPTTDTITTIYGTVSYADGRPAAGARVWVWLTNLDTKTDDEGKYSIMLEDSPLLAALRGNGLELRATLAELHSSPQKGIPPITMGAANGPVDLRLTTSGRLLSVLVTRMNDGEPVPGAAVQAQDGRIVYTNELGSAHFDGLTAGEWQVEVNASGFESTRAKASLLAQQDAVVEVQLQPGRLIRGVVKDEAGAPIEGVQYGYIRSGPMAFVHHHRTGTDGSYRVDYLPMEGGQISFEKPGYARETMTPVSAAGETEIVLDVVLKRGGTLAGRVVAAASGAPIPDATVTFAPATGNEVTATTGADGKFELVGLVQTQWGNDLLVEARGFAPAFVSKPHQQVAEDGLLSIKLGKGMSVAGRVENSRGEPVAGVWLTPLLDQSSRNIYLFAASQARTSADGSFRLGSLPPGVLLDVVPPRPYEALRRIKPTLNTSDYVIRLESMASVRGVVLNSATKEPVRRFNIRLDGAYEVSRIRTGVDFDAADGRFQIDEIAPGDQVKLIVRAPRHATRNVTLPLDGEDQVVLLDPTEESAIAGMVSDGAGRPIGGATVFLINTAGSQATPILAVNMVRGVLDGDSSQEVTRHVTDAQGRFRIDSVPSSGKVDLYIHASGRAPGRVHGIAGMIAERRSNLAISLGAPAVLSGSIDGPAPEGGHEISLTRIVPGAANEFVGYDTSADGAFRFTGLAPGTYEIISRKRYVRGEYWDHTPIAKLVLQVPEGEEVEVEVPRNPPPGN